MAEEEEEVVAEAVVAVAVAVEEQVPAACIPQNKR